MSILICAFPRGGSTFTLRALTDYLKSVYNNATDVITSLNEPETTPPTHATWARDYSNKPFKEVIQRYKDKKEDLSIELLKLLEKPEMNVILKTNYLTRIINYVEFPDTVFFIFVVRAPHQWVLSTGKNRGCIYYSLYDKTPTKEKWEEELVDLWLEITQEVVTFVSKRTEKEYIILNYYEYVDNPAFLEKVMNEKLGFSGKMPDYTKINYKKRRNPKQAWLDIPENKLALYRSDEIIQRFRQLGFNEDMVKEYEQKIEEIKIKIGSTEEK